MNYLWQIGAEGRFSATAVSGLISLFYRTNTHNQFFKIAYAGGWQICLLLCQMPVKHNQGWEIALDATPVMAKDFMWSTTLNFASNRNKIVALHEDLKEFVYGPTSFSSKKT